MYNNIVFRQINLHFNHTIPKLLIILIALSKRNTFRNSKILSTLFKAKKQSTSEARSPRRGTGPNGQGKKRPQQVNSDNMSTLCRRTDSASVSGGALRRHKPIKTKKERRKRKKGRKERKKSKRKLSKESKEREKKEKGEKKEKKENKKSKVKF